MHCMGGAPCARHAAPPRTACAAVASVPSGGRAPGLRRHHAGSAQRAAAGSQPASQRGPDRGSSSSSSHSSGAATLATASKKHKQRGRGKEDKPPGAKGGGGGGQPHAKGGGGGGSGGSGGSGGGRAAAGSDVEWLAASFDDEDDEGEEAFLAPYMGSVLKVYCVHTEPNFSLPWQRKRQYPSSSSGFVAAAGGGRRWVLTNAHSVDYHTQVKVKRRGDDRKFIARVLSVGVDCDIALLTVDDDEFWEGLTPLEFGSLPRLQDEVAVVGYPVGGESISITAGVVSRIEVTEYTHGSYDLLGVQIDAAINGGNSGGPVFNRRGQCVGIAFQALTGSDVENVGYVIPTPVVNHFLTDYLRSGSFTGFPALGIQWQRMESEALRRAYKMGPKQKGVLIRRVNATSHAAEVLRADDVLMSFDGTAVAGDGTVPFRTGERIAFSYLISQKYVGDEADLQVLRAGEVLKLRARLSKPAQLVPPHLGNRDPSYFIVAGLVFTVASEPYLEAEYGHDYVSEAPVKLLDKLYHGQPRRAGEEVVVLSQVLAAESTLGYEEVNNVQIISFNGAEVHNLRHLAELVMACREPYLRFDADYSETLILEAAAAFRDTAEVLEAYSIPAALSADLQKGLPPWPAAGAGGDSGSGSGGGDGAPADCGGAPAVVEGAPVTAAAA